MILCYLAMHDQQTRKKREKQKKKQAERENVLWGEVGRGTQENEGQRGEEGERQSIDLVHSER